MTKVQEGSAEIVFSEKVSSGVRVFLCIVGAFPVIFVPYELLIRPQWNEAGLPILFPSIISLGAILVGGMFIVAGLFGLNQTLRFSIQSRTILHSYESPFIPLRKTTYGFGDVTGLEIKTRNWNDGPSTYGLQVVFNNGRHLELGGFASKSEVEGYQHKVETLIR